MDSRSISVKDVCLNASFSEGGVASGHKCPNERGLVSVFAQVKEVWPLLQFRLRMCGLRISLGDGGVVSATI